MIESYQLSFYDANIVASALNTPESFQRMPTLQERTESVVMTFLLPHHLGGANVGVNGLLDYIQANPGQRAGEMVVTFAVTQRTIERLLKQLKAQSLIEFKGASKTGGYQ